MEMTMAPYQKPAGTTEKLYSNQLVNHAYNTWVRPHIQSHHNESKVAFVLDDQHLQSTKSIVSNDPTIHVQLAQHHPSTFRKMQTHATELTPTPSILQGEYIQLSAPPHSVCIDQADYCNTWKHNRDVTEHRLHTSLYAARAILRLTVSYRGLQMDGDENAEELVNDLQDMCIGTSYVIKPLTLQQCDPQYTTSGFTHGDCNAICYSYGTMQTYIFLIVNVTTMLSMLPMLPNQRAKSKSNMQNHKEDAAYKRLRQRVTHDGCIPHAATLKRHRLTMSNIHQWLVEGGHIQKFC